MYCSAAATDSIRSAWRMVVVMESRHFGPIEVPADRLWGAQTQRSLQNFDISGERSRAR
jgi:fumarate hydratase class II